MTGILKKILSVALLVLIFGCFEQYRNHGYIPSDEELSSVSVSQDDNLIQDQILLLLFYYLEKVNEI